MNAETWALLVEQATGEEREGARAYFYAERFGVPEPIGDECVGFKEPSCGDWNCVNPEHQVLAIL